MSESKTWMPKEQFSTSLHGNHMKKVHNDGPK